VKALSIPLYRLVHFQIEPGVCAAADLPGFLSHGRVLAAVYRVTTPKNDERHGHGMALRLILEPRHATAPNYSLSRTQFGYGASS